MKPSVSIIIVNYNTGDLLANCLASIRKNVRIPYEVIVSDNGSADGSVEACAGFWDDEHFSVIKNGENLGFARANNIAAARASGYILHFLNPDTEVPDGMDDDYRTAVDRPDAAYVNPLVNRDGSYENDRMPIPTVRDSFLWDIRSPKARYWYKGASVILSRENFRKVGGWCEEYFLYAEDTDLFLRFWEAGIPVKSLKSEIYHLGGGSSRRIWNDMQREVMTQKAYRKFFERNFSESAYVCSKLYYLFRTALRRPSRLGFYIRAWYVCSRSAD